MPISRTYLEVYRDGQRRLRNNTPVTNFNQQSLSKAFLDIMSVEVEKIYSDIDFIYSSLDPTRASGSDLDKLGLLVGVKRNEATVAVDETDTNFYFYIDLKVDWNIQKLIYSLYSEQEIDLLESNGYVVKTNGYVSRLILPRGIVISNYDNTITYTTIDEITFDADDTSKYVGIIATGTGPEYNVISNILINHNISTIPELIKLASMIKCTNTFPIQNGSYSMTDDEYRYNISIAKSALNSNELSIRKSALEIPGIRDILFEKNKFGNGTINIIVDGVSPLISDGLLLAVKENVQKNMAFGDVLFVSSPEYIGIELNFNIELELGITDSLSIRNQARNTVIQYINNLTIGGEIIWNQLVANVLEIDGIKDFIPVYFKCGKYDPVNKINKEQIILRFVNQTAKYNEKFYCDAGMITTCIA
mgnify:CR=1 FL=1